LNCPSANKRVLLAQITNALTQSGISCAVHKVLIAYTRDRRDGWRALLPHGCIVVLGRPLSPLQRFKTWLSSRSLRKLGHEVVVA
jgi:hypothetical protein